MNADSVKGSSGARIGKCAECAQSFERSRAGQRFCNPTRAKVSPCAKAWGARNTARGGPVLPLLQAWAMTRHAKPGTREADINRYARREITAIAKLFNEQDQADDRGSVLDYVGALMDSASLFVDRIR